MRGRFRNPFAGLFSSSRREQHLERFVLREYGRGRRLDEILSDPYVRNRTTTEQRERLLDHPEIVAAIGRQTVEELKLSAAALK